MAACRQYIHNFLNHGKQHIGLACRPAWLHPKFLSYLFGGVTDENPAVSSIFSDNNPFKRKNHDSESVSEPAVNRKNSDSSDSNIAKLKKAKKETEEKRNLGLRVEEATQTPQNPNLDDQELKSEGSENRKRKKRKREEVEREYEEKKYGAKAEEEVEKVVVGEKRKKAENETEDMLATSKDEGFDDENKLLRTVFVGNLPLKVKKKLLLKEFSKFGEVESIRIRSVPILDTKTPRKGAILQKKINEDADSVHAYIVFKSEQSAEGALSHNMAVVGGNHIRVDRACPPRKKLKGEDASLYDNKRTVFVGNLPFDVKDEEIYQLFCGLNNLGSSVEAVRVIRHPHMRVGKGIAYVLFKTREAANLVVKKRNLKLRDRELRLSHAGQNSTPSKRKNVASAVKPHSKKFAVDSRSPGSADQWNSRATLSYQGLRASKSGTQKKVHLGSSGSGKMMKTKVQKGEKAKIHQEKRPAVALRKARANASKDGVALKQVGTKRKLDSRTPDSSQRKKKAKRFR
ncbi:hypothetical protein Pint_03467 [Pistacia integerrima]|uniref:Uncharacterized protein n=1 Tax=Pistacia integerrima TaxID=434235 RepID=A0ACC0ZMJ7_9ROSI|nr:hypothetical protein Pint_03467 [Pistacia integerrima]